MHGRWGNSLALCLHSKHSAHLILIHMACISQLLPLTTNVTLSLLYYCRDLSGNSEICGILPPGTVQVNKAGTKIGTECGAAASPAVSANSTTAANTSDTAAAPAATETETPKP